MIRITYGNPENLEHLEKFIFKLIYEDGECIDIPVEAESLMTALATIGKHQHVYAENPVTKKHLASIRIVENIN